jgi:osmotically-inducible protein OsmY
MKTALISFLLGVIAGAFGLYLYQQPAPAAVTATSAGSSLSSKAHATADNLGARTRATADRMTDSIADKLQDWHLTSDDIKADLAKTGEVVRSKTAGVGDRIGDGRIVAVVKAKFILDRDLSALDINVDCRDGEVSLRGTVATPDFIGKAVVLALDTDGVRNVVSKLTVRLRGP